MIEVIGNNTGKLKEYKAIISYNNGEHIYEKMVKATSIKAVKEHFNRNSCMYGKVCVRSCKLVK